MQKALVIAGALITVACSSTADAGVDPDLVGTWLATTGEPAGVTAVFHEDGTFTWSNGDLVGTFEADGSTLTFSFPNDSAFCPGGTLVWEYTVSGETLTSDGVAGECPGDVPFVEDPISPDWIFERQ